MFVADCGLKVKPIKQEEYIKQTNEFSFYFMEECPFATFPDLRVLSKTSALGTNLICVFFVNVIDKQATCSQFGKHRDVTNNMFMDGGVMSIYSLVQMEENRKTLQYG